MNLLFSSKASDNTEQKSKAGAASAKTISWEEKTILKVAVLSEPYFPKQKLSVRFNSVVLQHMELEDLSNNDSENGRGGI